MTAISTTDHIALAMVRQAGNDGVCYGEAITEAQTVRLCVLGWVEMTAEIPPRVRLTAKGASALAANRNRSFA